MTDQAGVERLRAVVRRRSDAQTLGLNLLQLWIPKPATLREEDGVAAKVFGLLCGAAFALWRAAFLTDATRNRPAVNEAAADFLERWVTDNAILYSDEKRHLNWAVGFYLNNAAYRVREAQEHLRHLGETPQVDPPDVDESIVGEATNAGATWDVLHRCAEEATSILARVVGRAP